jgi:hypothetical protein
MCVAGAVILCAASAHADEADCIAARYKAAGKYAGCEAKAAAKISDDVASLKCRQKYAAAWTKLGPKYPGTSCEGARFVDNGLTIADNLTQLVWEKKTTVVDSGVNLSDRHDVDNSYSWSVSVGGAADGAAFTDFLDDLNSTGFAGQHDWRLPTIFELNSIVSTDAFACAAPCTIDPLFSPSKPTRYWSSSTSQDAAEAAWYMLFTGGHTLAQSKALPNFVRAVRGGF